MSDSRHDRANPGPTKALTKPKFDPQQWLAEYRAKTTATAAVPETTPDNPADEPATDSTLDVTTSPARPPDIASAIKGVQAEEEPPKPNHRPATATSQLAMFEIDVSEEPEAQTGEHDAVPIRTPDPHTFVRMLNVGRYRCVAQKVPSGRYTRKKYYLATEAVAQIVPMDAGAYDLYRWVSVSGDEGAILIPVTAADPYHRVLKTFASRGLKVWVRFTKDQRSEEYVVIDALNDLGEPVFRYRDKTEFVKAVFGNDMITSPDHPLVRDLLGKSA